MATNDNEEKHIPMQQQSDYPKEGFISRSGPYDPTGMFIGCSGPGPEIVRYSSIDVIDTAFKQLFAEVEGIPPVIYTTPEGARAWYASRELERQEREKQQQQQGQSSKRRENRRDRKRRGKR